MSDGGREADREREAVARGQEDRSDPKIGCRKRRRKWRTTFLPRLRFDIRKSSIRQRRKPREKLIKAAIHATVYLSK